MSVMQVGDVIMFMLDSFMTVFVAVPAFSRQVTVLMVIVVPVIVSMGMGVGDSPVLMFVAVCTAQEEKECARHDDRSDELYGQNGLPQPDPRERESKEGGRCKEHLGARSAELLGAANVEDGGGSIGQGAHCEGNHGGLKGEIGGLKGEAQSQVETACNKALREGDLGRGVAINDGGQVVV